MPLATRVVAGLKRRLFPERPRGVNLSRDLRDFLDVRSVRGVVDVGANVGQSAQFFHRLFPAAHIISIEPVSAVFAQLLEATRTLPRVRCINAAIGETERDVQINTFETTQLSSIGCAVDSKGVEMVRMETLSSIMRRVGLKQIDLLKIDVEGYELQVIEGARELLESGGVPLILAEAGVDDSNQRFTSAWRLQDALRHYGYEVYAFYDQSSWERHGSLLYLNVLFTSPALRDAARCLGRGQRVVLPANPLDALPDTGGMGSRVK